MVFWNALYISCFPDTNSVSGHMCHDEVSARNDVDGVLSVRSGVLSTGRLDDEAIP